MNAASDTKIFGIKVGVDPKWILGGLLVIAAILFFFETRTSDSNSGAAPVTSSGFHSLPTPNAASRNRAARTHRMRADGSNDRGVLRIRAVDATRGDIDPTLRLDLLARLQNVPPAKVTRSLFEIQTAPMPTIEQIQKLNTKVMPKPTTPAPVVTQSAPPVPQVNIPLKFYGFVRPAGRSSVNRGLFLEGDNVIVAKEGDVIDSKYLVVELTPVAARMSDTQLKQEQTLPLTPASNPQ